MIYKTNLDFIYGKDPSAPHENENHTSGKDQRIRGFRIARLLDHSTAIFHDLPFTERHFHLVRFLDLHDDLRHGSLYARR